jgi:gamma-glutamyltranspeptidase/glutathione hydrolase
MTGAGSNGLRQAGWLALALLAGACATAPVCTPVALDPETATEIAQAAPEPSSDIAARANVSAARHMIVAAHPLAAEAGLAMLRKGGSAIDAAIAAELVLGLVEPQSSGLGGGAFLLHYNATDDATVAYDGRETAPAGADEAMFLDETGLPLAFDTAVESGRSVGVPGLVAMLELAHREHGTLTWAALFGPAIELATNGFPVSERLHALLADYADSNWPDEARDYFYPDGAPAAVGTLLINPEYAATLRAIADGGAAAFYDGAVAEAMIDAVAADPMPGTLAAADFARYEALRRQPVCSLYRDYRICGMGPPSSGGVTTLAILGMIERFDMDDYGPNDPDAVHLIAEASRLAFADRARYLADDRFVPVPTTGLIDPPYLAARSALIDSHCSMGEASAGTPPGAIAMATPAPQREPAGTTQISVVDDDGNAVSLTASIETAFGSRRFAAGFLLNNQLTDFAFVPTDDAGKTVANRVEPGKRPRSSMAPTLVFAPDGDLHAVLGSPGGSRIIAYVTQALVGIIDWELSPQEAIDLPHMSNRNGATDLEAGTAIVTLAPDLAARGHEIRLVDMTSGLNAIVIDAGRLEGGSDPRREGVALGD